MLQGIGYNPASFPAGIEGDLTLTNATGGDLTTTLTRSVFYRNVTLNATGAGKQFLALGSGALLFCDVLTLTNNKCFVHCNGSGITGGAASVLGGDGGLAGSTGGVGSPGVHPSASSDTEAGGRGGRAGGGALGSSSGTTFDSSVLLGTGQSSPVPVYDFNTYTNPVHLYTTQFATARALATFTDKRIVGGTGGSGGYLGDQGGAGFGGSGAAGGGGGNGGGAGGVAFICARIIDISGGGVISANGVNGTAGSNAIAGTHANVYAAGGSGGGGGGGGTVILVYGELRQGSGLIQANGGNGGNGGNGAIGPGSSGSYHAGGGGGGRGGLGGTIYYFTQTTISNQAVPGAAGSDGVGGTDV